MNRLDSTRQKLWHNPNLRPIELLGVFSVMAMGLFAWLSTAGKSLAFITLLIAFLFDRGALKACIRDPVFITLTLFTLLVIGSAYGASVEFPESRTLQRKDAVSWLSLLAFWPMAWYLRGLSNRTHRLLILALFGLGIGMLTHANITDVFLFQLPENIGSRTGFQLGFFFSGLASGSALLGLALFAPLIWKQGNWRPARILLWCTAVYLMSYMLLASYSRASWLSLTITLAAMIPYWLQFGRFGWRKLGLGVLAALIVLAISLQGQISRKITERLTAEQETYQTILKGDFEHLPRTSVGYRIEVGLFGLQRWLERPWLGWGAGSTRYLITHSQNTRLLHPGHDPNSEEREWMSHVHNAYLEILLRFGLVGFALLTTAFILMISGLIRAYRAGKVPGESLRFTLGCFFMVSIWSLFDFRLLHGDWRAYWMIVAGIAHSYSLTSLQSPKVEGIASCAA